MKDMKAVEVTQIIMKTTGECLSAETVEARRDLRVSTAGLVSPLPDMGICARVESYVSSGKSTGVAIFRQVLVSISITKFFLSPGRISVLLEARGEPADLSFFGVIMPLTLTIHF